MQTVVTVSPIVAGLTCRCPACGQGSIFAGRFTLDLKKKCEQCGLHFGFADSGDGPAVFAIFILGVLMLGGALIIEFLFRPPVWLLLTLWSPLTLLMAFGLLRPLKALLVALQYRHKASQSGANGD